MNSKSVEKQAKSILAVITGEAEIGFEVQGEKEAYMFLWFLRSPNPFITADVPRLEHDILAAKEKIKSIISGITKASYTESKAVFIKIKDGKELKFQYMMNIKTDKSFPSQVFPVIEPILERMGFKVEMV